MRVRIYCLIEGFTIANRLGILSFIKQAVRSQSESFYSMFFEENKMKHKPYSFSPFFKNLSVVNDQIDSKEMVITVSSSDVEFIIHLINGCQKNKLHTYKNLKIEVTRVELAKSKTIQSDVALFKTLSPVLVEDQRKKPVLASDPNFETELNFISNSIMQSSLGRSLYRPLVIKNNALRKTVVKENFHQNQDDYLYFTANHGVFELEGDARDLNFFYLNGIGLRTGTAFGCLDIVEGR